MSRELARAPLMQRLENLGNASRGAYDPVDAARITRAWHTLHPRHLDLLRMVYLWHAGREVVCRRLRIPRRPPELFEQELAAASAALARALEGDARERSALGSSRKQES
ncbi:hypothetical protein [Paraburkholderia sacchari]|uniref:hypothetical protein n=1 Tax=Paraburkholderia sacchari TaxID=159450 RepID=UPI001BCE2E1D|nr:hypothetical protein [Paraburkholderia sacchari]